MVIAANPGFPRIGPKRELKKAVEKYWSGKTSESEMLAVCRSLRKNAWLLQKEIGIDHIPSGDFSLYDHVLDTIAMVGCIPERYGWNGGKVDLGKTYFAMARGTAKGEATQSRPKAHAMEMTKWFDTNYHYIVPEFSSAQKFRFSSARVIDEFAEAKELGIITRPVLIGPVSFLLLGKSKDKSLVNPLSLLEKLLPVYEEVLKKLSDAGAEWVQMDEPFLALDTDKKSQKAFKHAYAGLAGSVPNIKLLLATYFDSLKENISVVSGLPVAAVHMDIVRAPQQLDEALERIDENQLLSLGVVDGRNVWRTDLDEALAIVKRAVNALGSDRVMISPSCSLLHVPVDLDLETGIDAELRGWLAFAKQKLEEVVTLSLAAGGSFSKVEKTFAENRTLMESRKSSPRIHNESVKKRLLDLNGNVPHQRGSRETRREVQQKRLGLPMFPTTTIGSFPQTKDVRSTRADLKAGRIDEDTYNAFIREIIKRTIGFQEQTGIDVLVHGEFERNDMVEYFGELLEGFAITKNGWVQSYGSRCTKPPVIYGDVYRAKPMTVEWAGYAQSLTEQPVKGMLTGPVTILQWSFVRNDQARSETCKQISLAIRDEVLDLEAAGIGIIQIDEPALREGLPLRRRDWDSYLSWAVEAFRMASSGVKDETQIHTHMCYAEFNDIIEHIAAMDADVISIETSRSQMEILGAFTRFKYPGEIGPGVYDVHSPRVPPLEEMESLLIKALEVLSPQQIWVNPDCGLKTRGWDEVRAALAVMVEAAKNLRRIAEEKNTAKQTA